MPEKEKGKEREKPAGEKQPVSEEEMQTIFSGPAIAANKIYATLGTGGMRLTFCEGGGKAVPPRFRTAVQLGFPDAFALRDLLNRQLENVEVVVETTEAEPNG